LSNQRAFFVPKNPKKSSISIFTDSFKSLSF